MCKETYTYGSYTKTYTEDADFIRVRGMCRKCFETLAEIIREKQSKKL